jgi:hypothetical protein
MKAQQPPIPWQSQWGSANKAVSAKEYLVTQVATQNKRRTNLVWREDKLNNRAVVIPSYSLPTARAPNAADVVVGEPPANEQPQSRPRIEGLRLFRTIQARSLATPSGCAIVPFIYWTEWKPHRAASIVDALQIISDPREPVHAQSIAFGAVFQKTNGDSKFQVISGNNLNKTSLNTVLVCLITSVHPIKYDLYGIHNKFKNEVLDNTEWQLIEAGPTTELERSNLWQDLTNSLFTIQ